MAEKDKTATPSGPPEFSEADQARARQWFKKAADCREKRDYNYAIECYITGLGYWPEAVEEGHMPLRSLAIQRQQAGGKKPSFMEGVKRSMSGKDFRKNMLNAEYLLALDPQHYGYAEGVLRNACKAGLLQTLKWVAPLVYDLLKKDKKPDKGKFKTFRDTLIEAAARANEWGQAPLETWFLDQAVNSLDYILMRSPGDEDLRSEQRDLAGRLTIARGKYEDAEDFRDSLRDAEKQKRLHDSDRTQQAEASVEALIAAAREEYEASPDAPQKLSALVDILVKTEKPVHENEALRLLQAHYEKTRNYNLKVRADDIRLRQLTRQARELAERARRTGSEEDKQQHRLAVLEQRQTALEVYRERVAQYPTDLRLKFKLGAALFESGQYDEAIPILQAAQADPRNRVRSRLMIGRAFFEQGSHAQAAEVLREALEAYELTDDTSKELLYWLGRAYESAGQIDDARTAYGKLLREDYNYRDGEARKRLDALK